MGQIPFDESQREGREDQKIEANRPVMQASEQHPDETHLIGLSRNQYGYGQESFRVNYRLNRLGLDQGASWSEGNLESARRSFRGVGPKGYRRNDEFISEDVHERLTLSPLLDASQMQVSVKDGEVALGGQVASRDEKRLAEDIAASVPGVMDVMNNLSIASGDKDTVGQNW